MEYVSTTMADLYLMRHLILINIIIPNRYGFNANGQAADGLQRTVMNGMAYGGDIFDSEGFNWQGDIFLSFFNCF